MTPAANASQLDLADREQAAERPVMRCIDPGCGHLVGATHATGCKFDGEVHTWDALPSLAGPPSGAASPPWRVADDRQPRGLAC